MEQKGKLKRKIEKKKISLKRGKKGEQQDLSDHGARDKKRRKVHSDQSLFDSDLQTAMVMSTHEYSTKQGIHEADEYLSNLFSDSDSESPQCTPKLPESSVAKKTLSETSAGLPKGQTVWKFGSSSIPFVSEERRLSQEKETGKESTPNRSFEELSQISLESQCLDDGSPERDENHFSDPEESLSSSSLSIPFKGDTADAPTPKKATDNVYLKKMKEVFEMIPLDCREQLIEVHRTYYLDYNKALRVAQEKAEEAMKEFYGKAGQLTRLREEKTSLLQEVYGVPKQLLMAFDEGILDDME